MTSHFNFFHIQGGAVIGYIQDTVIAPALDSNSKNSPVTPVILYYLVSFSYIKLYCYIGISFSQGGAGMCVMGYIPDTVTAPALDGNGTTITPVRRDAGYYATKSMSYVGPILMGCGFFAIIVSCVLYCEIVDR